MTYELYSGTPPHVAGCDTSLEAAESVAADVSRMASLVLSLVRRAGEYGVTCAEAEISLSMKHQTASARFRELVLRGLIVDSGRRRRTDGQRTPSRVYVMAGGVG